MELSKRLQAVADLVSEDMVVADVGTDHGYIPIYLIETKRCKRAFAMDVNQGPLIRAEKNIQEHQLSDKIEIRLSDGAKALAVGECDSVIVAGMGGALTVKIISESVSIFKSLKEFILQPQSELSKVRAYLQGEGFLVVEEEMVLEDGKFYPMMRVVPGVDRAYSETELLYGRKLLAKRHPILKQFLEKELYIKLEIQNRLSEMQGEQIERRRRELATELSYIKEALEVYS